MNEQTLNKTATLAALPPVWNQNTLPDIQTQLANSPKKLVVLDDDPTGTQTIYDLPVLTEWSVEILAKELSNDAPGFYILTNSRSLNESVARKLNVDIGLNLSLAAHQTKREYALVSRSDSTLRGHFPLELDALSTTLAQSADVWLLIQFFLEGGRYTLDDVHYVAEGDNLVPAGQTPFAADKVFGYKSSNLKEWVEEKSGGRFRAEEIASISIDDIRNGGPSVVTEKLMRLPKGSVCVVNSASYEDQEVFVNGLLAAELRGKTFMYRTAASFVRPRVGLPARPLLTAAELLPKDESVSHGGLTIVGSYVPKTTAQLNMLLASELVSPLEIDVEKLLDESSRELTIQSAIDLINDNLEHGRDMVVFTSRKLIAADDRSENLAIGSLVSSSLVRIVKELAVRPRYLIAKGGITSSDVATDGLGIKRAIVQGQILPGIPVWKTQEESRFPDMSYVIFPGNVGDDSALIDAISKFNQ